MNAFKFIFPRVETNLANYIKEMKVKYACGMQDARANPRLKTWERYCYRFDGKLQEFIEVISIEVRACELFMRADFLIRGYINIPGSSSIERHCVERLKILGATKNKK